MKERQQNSTTHPISILLVSSQDHITGVPNAQITVFAISKDGGTTWVAPDGGLVSSSYGWYTWTPFATDRNALGELKLHVEAAGCDPYDEKYDIVAYDPYAYISLPAAERTAIADAILTRDWTQIASWPARCMLQALRFLRNRWWIDQTNILHVTAENDTTEVWTAQVQSQPGADPLTGITPN